MRIANLKKTSNNLYTKEEAHACVCWNHAGVALCVLFPKKTNVRMCSDEKCLRASVHVREVPLSCRTEEFFNPASVPANSRSVKPLRRTTNPDSAKTHLMGLWKLFYFFPQLIQLRARVAVAYPLKCRHASSVQTAVLTFLAGSSALKKHI